MFYKGYNSTKKVSLTATNVSRWLRNLDMNKSSFNCDIDTTLGYLLKHPPHVIIHKFTIKRFMGKKC